MEHLKKTTMETLEINEMDIANSFVYCYDYYEYQFALHNYKDLIPTYIDMYGYSDINYDLTLVNKDNAKSIYKYGLDLICVNHNTNDPNVAFIITPSLALLSHSIGNNKDFDNLLKRENIYLIINTNNIHSLFDNISAISKKLNKYNVKKLELMI